MVHVSSRTSHSTFTISCSPAKTHLKTMVSPWLRELPSFHSVDLRPMTQKPPFHSPASRGEIDIRPNPLIRLCERGPKRFYDCNELLLLVYAGRRKMSTQHLSETIGL